MDGIASDIQPISINYVRPHSSLRYRPPAPEAFIPLKHKTNLYATKTRKY